MIDQGGHISALLYGYWCDAWQGRSVISLIMGSITDDEDPGIVWERQIRLDFDAAVGILWPLECIQER